MGPLKAFGKVFNTIGTVVDAVDSSITRTSKLLDMGFDAIEIPTANMIADLNCDNIVDDANRDVRIATAKAEAIAIREALKADSNTTPKKRATTTAKK